MTQRQVAFVHTVPFLVDEFKTRMAAQLPSLRSFHVLNESLLRDLLEGAAAATVYRRVVGQILLAVDAGADIVVVTCSSTSPALDIARQLTSAQLLKIDDPMAAKAVSLGARIGLLCTAQSTVAPSTALLHAHAASAGKTLSVHPRLEAAAYEALRAGARERHDQLVLEAARELAKEVDVIVLAQASLASLRESIAARIGKPVLASPGLLMDRLLELTEAV